MHVLAALLHSALNHLASLSHLIECRDHWHANWAADQSAYLLLLRHCWTVGAVVVDEEVNATVICYDYVQERGQEIESCDLTMNWHAEV